MPAEYNAQRKNFDIVVAEQGYIFVANMEGILSFDLEHWTTIHLPNYERVMALSKDESGKVWYKGINTTGFIEANEKGELKAIAADADLSLFEPQTKLVLNNNDIFEAIVGQGLHIYNQKENKELYITTVNGLCSNNINAICVDAVGNIWGATDNGVFVMKYPTPYGKYTPNEGLHGEVKCITNYKGSIYAGTNQGLFQVTDYNTVKKIDGVIGCHKLKAYGKDLLIAAANGLWQFDGKTIQQLSNLFTIDVEIENDKFICTCQDGIWLVEKNGNSRMIDNVTSETLYEAQYKLPEEWQTDAVGKNLYHVGGDENENKRWLGPYKDYLINTVFVEDETLWLGTDNGLFTANRDYMKFTISMTPPTMHFGRIYYYTDSASIVWGGYPDYLQEEKLSLPSNVKFININFATKRIGCLTRSLYSYNVDNSGWTEWSERTNFMLNNPAYGSHNFVVKTKNAYGMESEPITIVFDVEYPWYLRWYSIILYLIVLWILTHQVVEFRTRQLEEASLRLEKMVDERTAELKNTQKELVRSEKMATVGKLTQGLIDRILNPMNYINNFSRLNIDLLKDLKENVEDVKDKIEGELYEDCTDILEMLEQNLSKISDHGLNTSRILKAMEGMLKEPKLNITEYDINLEMRPIVESAKAAFEEKTALASTKIEIKAPSEPILVRCDIQAISRVIQSMILNSVYAINKRFERGDETQGSVIIELAKYEKSVFITIRDNGIGIEETILEKVFDPFFTTKTTSEAAGVGLYLCKNIITMMNGDIVVTSEKNKFTEFKIVLWQN